MADNILKMEAFILPTWTAAFFVVYLVLLLLIPAFLPTWWENIRRVALISLPFAASGLGTLIFYAPKTAWHALFDYFGFMLMLVSLYVISSGITLSGICSAGPINNTLCLLIGSIIASWIGTSGAALMLCRPFFQANSQRLYTLHIVPFFIFLVANIGGLLSPLGDPPLYLGWQHGVAFTFPLTLWPIYLFTLGFVLLIFAIIDTIAFAYEPATSKAYVQNYRFQPKLEGGRYLLLLLSTLMGHVARGMHVVSEPLSLLWITMMTGLAFAGLSADKRQKTQPLWEVALVFAAIFATMPAALQALGRLPLQEQAMPNQAWHFFWLTGIVSAFLDNAPTYLTSAALANRLLGLSGEKFDQLAVDPVGKTWLQAISCGAVMMGALTYIGNGPNLLIRRLAGDLGLKPPSFAVYSGIAGLILLPVFAWGSFCFFT